MPVYRLRAELAFPPPADAEPSGLLAVGGDLSSERLLLAYACGIFPWYEKPPILWFSPDPRMLLEPERLHVARRLRRRLRQGHFELTLDAAFPHVIRACGDLRREDGTWITPEMIDAYVRLHEEGWAHSCEAWQRGELVGGVYGVSLGAAFFAESMFHTATDASKAALTGLVWQLADWGFTLVDCQLPTAHLASLGARPQSRGGFLAALAAALRAPTRRGRWRLDPGLLARRLAEQPTPPKRGRSSKR
jgi:leucyl/phenylalanyl-tRNA--protein transferase